MKVLCLAQVEDRTNLDKQILKQTVQPDQVTFYVDTQPAKGITERRKRIAENHKTLRAIVIAYEPDLIWQVEQDSVLPEDCLERLLMRYSELKDKGAFGYISGIEVGRHGCYHLGAWRNFKTDSFESLDYKLKGIQQVEATGFYCLLAPTHAWLSGQCTWNGEPYGPDVVWGLTMPYDKYVDMDLQIGHQLKGGIIMPEHISTTNVRFFKNENGDWKFKEKL